MARGSEFTRPATDSRLTPESARGQSRFYFQTSAEATAVLDKALSGVWARGIRASGVVVDAGRPQVARVIAAEADVWGAGLIVVARRPRSAISALLPGSVSSQVMRAANCPVLVARGPRRVTAEVSPNVSR
jgi:nucleotide-binding universal stress UspA family protein